MGQRAVQEFKGPVNLDGVGDLIGIRYLRYYPEKIFELPTGLTTYESKFKNMRDSWKTTSCIEQTLLWFSGATENISIATIQPIQNGISSKPRHLSSEH